MRPEAHCSHPGCDRPATEVAVVESAWEDSATGSALMVCSDHADRYIRHTFPTTSDVASPADPMRRVRRRGSAQ